MDEDLIVEDVRRDDRLLRKHGIVHDDDDAKASDSASSDDIDDETDIKPAWEDEDDKNLRVCICVCVGMCMACLDFVYFHRLISLLGP